MAMNPTVKVDAEDVKRSIAWAIRSSTDYEQGRKNGSLIYERPGIARDSGIQAMGRMGECVACRFFDLDPYAELDWSPHCDSGFDARIDGFRTDIKTTLRSRCLIWPRPKNEFLLAVEVDRFVLVNAKNNPVFEICGWTSKRVFIQAHHVAPPPDSFDPDTKFMRAEELFPMFTWKDDCRDSNSPAAKTLAAFAIRHRKQFEFIDGRWP